MIKSLPIKSTNEIQTLKNYFLKVRMRDYLLFILGINVPLKLQTLLEMKKKNLAKENDQYIFDVNGYKIYLNAQDSELLTHFIHEKSPDDYLFESIKTKSPLTRQQFHRILSTASCEIGYEQSLGPQALKKTFAYHAYIQGIDIYDLMHVLGHQTKSETYYFIDITPSDNKSIQIHI
ncbi:tyrosine-type recombinase/integrase [Macrococcus equi]|uniref:tyrosine-type recombinase/integrase n=1 Tax=Macrococcus equi TaxID=3395462 RepID=UPI0039BEA1BC